MKPRDSESSLDIVIVNWNSGEQLRHCLCSIQESGFSDVSIGKVIIVDNNSSDESLQQIQGIDLPLIIIENEENRGFAAACNQGAEIGSAKYLLFLNPDTQLFEFSLKRPVRFLESEQGDEVGIVGVQLVNEEGKPHRSCARFPTPTRLIAETMGLNKVKSGAGRYMETWDHEDSRVVDQVMGAFFFVRRGVFEELEGFDERFFVFYEEVDFAYRARQRDWMSYYLASTKVFHREGGTTEQIKARRLFYSLQSRLQYARKHFETPGMIAVYACTLVIEPISRIVYGLAQRSFGDIPQALKAYGLLVKSLLKGES